MPHEDQSLCAKEIKIKLNTILNSLVSESQGVKEFYHRKISDLYEEIAKKEIAIEKLEKKVQENEKKSLLLSWKLIEKQSLIEVLEDKVLSLKEKIKGNIHQDAEEVQLQGACYPHHEDIDKWLLEGPAKQFNISQYFIKAIGTSKNSTKIATSTNSPNTTGSNFPPQMRRSSLKKINLDHSNTARSLLKVRSLNTQKIRLMIPEPGDLGPSLRVKPSPDIFHEHHPFNKMPSTESYCSRLRADNPIKMVEKSCPMQKIVDKFKFSRLKKKQL